MELTKQQKMLIGVAVLGVGAVAVDRLVLGPPETASASVAPATPPTPAGLADAALEPPEAPAAPELTPGQPGPATLPSFATLTERLAKSAEDRPLPEQPGDPFSLPEGWDKSTATAAIPEAGSDADQLSKLLLSQYRLDGTFRSVVDEQVVMLAVVSGGKHKRQTMNVGDEIRVETGRQPAPSSQSFEVYRLIEIGNRAVVWALKRDPSQKVVMRAPEVL